MLEKSAKKRHVSFHTPGHKIGKWDITELSYSDNLSCPRGCIARAEADITNILGAKKSYILTDGSTCGVFSMLYAAKKAGVKTVMLPLQSHKSAFNACATLGIIPLIFDKETQNAETGETLSLWQAADALFLTSPDYYGNVPDLRLIRARCERENKLLLIDGAHGGHLHFDKTLYAGAYADLWVDGVHKSLPAFTQGAVVSARTQTLAEFLREGVDVFRTTSPSYPIMASVEYAVKYPRNETMETLARDFQNTCERVLKNEDWTKLCARFGENAFQAEKDLEKQGVFPEFCDGNFITFYLSPATKPRDFLRLKKTLQKLFEKYPVKETQRIPAPLVLQKTGETEWVELGKSEHRICAANCGLFPPCTPLIVNGEKITGEKITLLSNASNVFGIYENKILVYKEE